jgi:hypothetical protein
MKFVQTILQIAFRRRRSKLQGFQPTYKSPGPGENLCPGWYGDVITVKKTPNSVLKTGSMRNRFMI